MRSTVSLVIARLGNYTAPERSVPIHSMWRRPDIYPDIRAPALGRSVTNCGEHQLLRSKSHVVRTRVQRQQEPGSRKSSVNPGTDGMNQPCSSLYLLNIVKNNFPILGIPVTLSDGQITVLGSGGSGCCMNNQRTSDHHRHRREKSHNQSKTEREYRTERMLPFRDWHRKA
ncbi:hypothetical protein EDC04DRAFT_2662512 [Pisolithus marmoratus]|nr:hypothetical protein EDC04DRAFT_2662512 [Pisolithus marmoratus]